MPLGSVKRPMATHCARNRREHVALCHGLLFSATTHTGPTAAASRAAPAWGGRWACCHRCVLALCRGALLLCCCIRGSVCCTGLGRALGLLSQVGACSVRCFCQAHTRTGPTQCSASACCLAYSQTAGPFLCRATGSNSPPPAINPVALTKHTCQGLLLFGLHMLGRWSWHFYNMVGTLLFVFVGWKMAQALLHVDMWT